jgi:hypothetical protein
MQPDQRLDGENATTPERAGTPSGRPTASDSESEKTVFNMPDAKFRDAVHGTVNHYHGRGG